jgi:hypothetical protein
MESRDMAIRERSAQALVSDPILNWRLEQLMHAGYEAEDALQLAVRAEIDLHRAISLIHDGCPPKTALEILL